MLSLNELFRERLIPWAENHLDERLIVARPVMKEATMPPGTQLAPHPIVGKKVMVRNRRQHNYRLYHAQWPEAGLHDFEVPKVVCVIAGTTDYIAGKYIISCNEGQFIVLPPLTPNTIGGRSHLEGERRKNGYCELLQITILPEAVYCNLCTSRGEKHQDYPEQTCTIYQLQAVRLFHDFMEEALREQNADVKLQEHLFAAFFRYLYQEIVAGREVYQRFQISHDHSTDHSIGELKNYIKANLKKSLTHEEAARHLFMSQRHFTRYIRQQTGKSFVEILTECRIEEAKRLLSETSASVLGITFLVGLKSVSHFSDVFQRQVGCSPGAYREQCKKQNSR